MAFDIYGNHLTPGYCEVHPDYPESYPCQICYEENAQRQEPQMPEPEYNEADYLASLLGECGHRQPTEPQTICDINGKMCLLEENLPCDLVNKEGE